jgi:hypothetical protein
MGEGDEAIREVTDDVHTNHGFSGTEVSHVELPTDVKLGVLDPLRPGGVRVLWTME